MSTPNRPLGELIAQFQAWISDAAARGESEPEAMSLATSDSAGVPAVRIVLLKHADERGFVFYTNLGSQKGQELAANAQAALCFHWKASARQVRVQGAVEPVSAAEADAYFASRARESRIGAWASKQSQPMRERFELEKRVAKHALRFHVGSIPRPDFWSGFRLIPRRIEFWEAKPFRLHERIRYEPDASGLWQGQTLFP